MSLILLELVKLVLIYFYQVQRRNCFQFIRILLWFLLKYLFYFNFAQNTPMCVLRSNTKCTLTYLTFSAICYIYCKRTCIHLQFPDRQVYIFGNHVSVFCIVYYRRCLSFLYSKGFDKLFCIYIFSKLKTNLFWYVLCIVCMFYFWHILEHSRNRTIWICVICFIISSVLLIVSLNIY